MARSSFQSSLGPDGPAAAGTDHVAMLVEEDVVVHHEQPLALDELVERAGLQGDDVVRPRRNVVAPGLPGIDRPGERIQSSAGVQENIRRIWIEGGAISPP
jgi:hypothetical protein